MMSVTVFLSRIDIYFMTIVKHFKVNLIDLKESLHPVPSKWFEVFSCSVGIGIFSERKHNHSKGKRKPMRKGEYLFVQGNWISSFPKPATSDKNYHFNVLHHFCLTSYGFHVISKRFKFCKNVKLYFANVAMDPVGTPVCVVFPHLCVNVYKYRI